MTKKLKSVPAPPPLARSGPVTNLLTQNLLLERQVWLRRQLDPRRDIDFECGHPQTITVADYKGLYVRGDLAARVVDLWPEESWAVSPQVYETEDDTETEFEKAWTELEKRLRLYALLQRADMLSGVGRFGVMLLGIDDGKDLSEPAEGVNEQGEVAGASEHQLLYLRPFDESLVSVASFESNVQNPRFGYPTAYNIQFSEDATTVGTGKISGKVHWSRVIHLADNRTTSDVYGAPRMERVFNRLLDVRKIAGGSGEMFWKGGFPGLSMEMIPQGDEQVDFDPEATKDQIEAYMNGLQRYIATIGMQAKSLTVQVADPGPHLDVQIRLIAMAIGVPWRVLMGSEAAQLASEQDTRNWNKRVANRQQKYVTPYILEPLIQRLVAFGVLPEPQEVLIDWPDLNTVSDKDRADTAAKQATALSQYVQGGVDVLVPPFHFLTEVIGMEDDQARAIVDDAEREARTVDDEGVKSRFDTTPPPPDPLAAPPSAARFRPPSA